MNCRDFQNEFEDRAGLSDAANLHLKDCADCEKLYRQQSHIWQMIETLPEVAAPANFNARFRSHIAGSKTSDFRPKWWKSLRYVVPIFAMVLVMTIFFASQNFFVSTPQPTFAVVKEDVKPTDLLNDEVQAKPPSNMIASGNSDYKNANYEIHSTSTNTVNSNALIQKNPIPEIPKSNKKELPAKDKDDFKGYRDIGVNPAPPPILPNGISGENKIVSNAEDFVKQNNQDVTEMLSVLGIETISANGVLRVISVKENSPAARSGLKTGDLILSIDGKNPLMNSFNTIRNLTVMRGTQNLTISTRTQ